ncbi:hypothetical protein PORUE0001_0778 [Porphyromonas uenonis 60-3]|uniref:Uncharacterized protein n=1 Tax=Porphyromonas uenonis 60-3 TaxID=596327 RepID=C2MAS9_9PORP|nr:hypothetical protein PORUE0001_0778 [Porphyromonas uenonis 60-3]
MYLGIVKSNLHSSFHYSEVYFLSFMVVGGNLFSAFQLQVYKHEFLVVNHLT